MKSASFQSSAKPLKSPPMHLLEDVTSPSYWESMPISKLFEEPRLPEQLENPTKTKRRGRKRLRPHEEFPVKTEIKDKLWLRGFRAFAKALKHRDQLPPEDAEFWTEYLSPNGKPGKGQPFSSFSKKYKAGLFRNPSFCTLFRDWFFTYGAQFLALKISPNSPAWGSYFTYAMEELVQFK